MAELRFPEAGGRGRSTSATGRAVVAEAARAVDADLGERIAACEDWRGGYVAAFRDLTAAAARSPDAPVAMARAGIDAARARLEICEADAVPRPLAEAFTVDEPAPPTAVRRGEGERVRELAVPDGGELLHGDALRRRVQEWARAGVVEPGCAEAVDAVVANPDWLACEGRRVALLGAGAELGPLGPLAEWGAEVLAVDLPGRRIWERIARLGRAGAGTVRAAVGARPDARLEDAAGIDLIGGLGRLRTWLAQEGDGRPLVLATHAYADGAKHVLASAAADALAGDLLARRDDTALAYLATPTDSYLVAPDIVAAARRPVPRRAAVVRGLTRGRLLAPSYREELAGEDGRGWGLADALVPQQGPNYALAKRLQRWRGTLAAVEGHTVSFNVAPASWTASVTKNRMLAAAYAGAHRFGIRIFAPETTRALMAALLVHDLHAPARSRAHPDELFCANAAHGGLWRAPYEPRSALGLAAVLGLPRALLRRG